jgi:hypothetical protein
LDEHDCGGQADNAVHERKEQKNKGEEVPEARGKKRSPHQPVPEQPKSDMKASNLWKMKATSLKAQSKSPSSSSNQSQDKNKPSDQSTETSGGLSSGVTRMLVLVTSVFLFCTLPASVYFIVDSYLRNYENEDAHTNSILQVTKVSHMYVCAYKCIYVTVKISETNHFT